MLHGKHSTIVLPSDTARLSLREATESDSFFILKLLTEPSWKKFIRQHDINSENAAQKYLIENIIGNYKDGMGFWLVELKDSKEPVGICGLTKRPHLQHIDIGFAFLEKYWGHGLAAESSKSVISYSYKHLNASTLWAITALANMNSIRLLKSLNFKYKCEIKNPDNKIFAVFELQHNKP